MEEDGNTVVPGEPVGVIEEYLAGKNVYVDAENSVLRSKIIGLLLRDNVKHIVEIDPVKEPRLLSKGDVVYGYLDGVRETIAFVKIMLIEKGREKGVPEGILLLRPYSGILPASNISSDPVRNIFNVYSYGDVLRAYVSEEGGPPYVLSTRGREYGVVLARCPHCMSILRKKGNYLVCPYCGSRVRKKASIYYLVK